MRDHQLEIERLRYRFQTCRENLQKAKGDIKFWNDELNACVEQLVQVDQSCFEFFDNCMSYKGEKE